MCLKREPCEIQGPQIYRCLNPKGRVDHQDIDRLWMGIPSAIVTSGPKTSKFIGKQDVTGYGLIDELFPLLKQSSS